MWLQHPLIDIKVKAADGTELTILRDNVRRASWGVVETHRRAFSSAEDTQSIINSPGVGSVVILDYDNLSTGPRIKLMIGRIRSLMDDNRKRCVHTNDITHVYLRQSFGYAFDTIEVVPAADLDKQLQDGEFTVTPGN